MTAWWVDSLTIKKIIQDCKKDIVHIYELFGNGARSESGQIINIQRDILDKLQDVFDSDPLEILKKVDGLKHVMNEIHNNQKSTPQLLEGAKDYIFKTHNMEYRPRKNPKKMTDSEKMKQYIQLARVAALEDALPDMRTEEDKQAEKDASEKRVKNQIYEQIIYKIYTYLYQSKESIEHNIDKLNSHYQEFVQRYGKDLADIELIDIKYIFKSPAQLLYHLNDEDEDMRTKIFKIFKPNTQLFEIDYWLLLYSTRLCIQHPQYVQTFFNFSVNMCHEFSTNQELSPESDRQQAYQSVRDTITYISSILFDNNYTDIEINNHINILKLHISKNSDDYYRKYDKIPVIKKVSNIIRIAWMDKLDSYSQNDQESIIKICTEIEEIDKESYNKQIKEYSNQYHTIANQLSSYNKNCLNNIISKSPSKTKIIEKISTIDKESLIFAIQFINDLLSINKEVDYDNIYWAISQDNTIVAKLKNISKEDNKNYIFVERIYQYCKSQWDMDNFFHYISKCLILENKLEGIYRKKFNDLLLSLSIEYYGIFINTITSINKKKAKLYILYIEFIRSIEDFEINFHEINTIFYQSIDIPIEILLNNLQKYFYTSSLQHKEYIQLYISIEYFIENFKNIAWCDYDHKLLYMYLSKNNKYNQFRIGNYESIDYYNNKLLSLYKYRNKSIQHKLSMINLEILQKQYHNNDIISWLSEEEIRNNIISSIDELYDVDNFENSEKEKILDTIQWEQLKQYMSNNNITHKYKELEKNPLHKYHKHLIKQKQYTQDNKNNIEECVKNFLSLLQEIKTYCRGWYNLMEIRIENITGTINKEMNQDWEINHHDNKDNAVEIFLSTDPIFIATHMRWCLKHKWPSSSHKSSNNRQWDKEWKKSVETFSYYDILLPNCFNIMIRNNKEDIIADQLLYITTMDWEPTVLVDTLYWLKNNQILSISIWTIINRCKENNIKSITIPKKAIESVSTTFEKLETQLIYKNHNVQYSIVSNNDVSIDKDLIWYNEISTSDKYMIISI